ncbi:MAG: hypothetical protein M3357_07170, partial [Actinomycetota bacterium]|nr:hypothetical protein [Actinomycetota bacterium]
MEDGIEPEDRCHISWDLRSLGPGPLPNLYRCKTPEENFLARILLIGFGPSPALNRALKVLQGARATGTGDEIPDVTGPFSVFAPHDRRSTV